MEYIVQNEEELELKYNILLSKIYESKVLQNLHKSILFTGYGITPANKKTESLVNYYKSQMEFDSKYISHYIIRTAHIINNI